MVLLDNHQTLNGTLTDLGIATGDKLISQQPREDVPVAATKKHSKIKRQVKSSNEGLYIRKRSSSKRDDSEATKKRHCSGMYVL